jgi:hypothetical protein
MEKKGGDGEVIVLTVKEMIVIIEIVRWYCKLIIIYKYFMEVYKIKIFYNK